MRHPLVAAIASAKDAAKDLSFLLLEQAQILDGELPEDPAAFAEPAQPAGAARQSKVSGLAEPEFQSRPYLLDRFRERDRFASP